MKKNVLLFLSVVCSMSVTNRCFAQQNEYFKYTAGKPYDVIDAPTKLYINTGDYVLAMKLVGKTIHLQKLSANNITQSTEKEFDMPEHGVLNAFEKVGNAYYMFYDVYDKEYTTEQLFYKEINVNAGTIQPQGTLMCKSFKKIAGDLKATGMYAFATINKFNFVCSSDSSKHMVWFRMKPEVKRDAKSYDLIGFCVYDAHMKVLWQKEVKMPYTEKKMNNLDYAVDNNGNVYILTTVYDDETTHAVNRDEGVANYHIELLTVTPNSTDIHASTITLGNKFINELGFFSGAGNKIICAGYYSDDNSGNAKGLFMFKAGVGGEIIDQHSYEIPLSVLNQYESERTQKKNKKKSEDNESSFSNLNLKLVEDMNDGSIVLLGEQYWERTTTVSNGRGGFSTYTTFYNGDMLLTKISKNNEVVWMKKLPKNQVGGIQPGTMSFKYRFDSEHNKHDIYFVDNIKNKDLPLDKAPAKYTEGKSAYLTAYTVEDGTGDVKKSYLFDIDDVNDMKLYQFSIKRIFNVGTNDIMLEAYKKQKEDILIKIHPLK